MDDGAPRMDRRASTMSAPTLGEVEMLGGFKSCDISRSYSLNSLEEQQRQRPSAVDFASPTSPFIPSPHLPYQPSFYPDPSPYEPSLRTFHPAFLSSPQYHQQPFPHPPSPRQVQPLPPGASFVVRAQPLPLLKQHAHLTLAEHQTHSPIDQHSLFSTITPFFSTSAKQQPLPAPNRFVHDASPFGAHPVASSSASTDYSHPIHYTLRTPDSHPDAHLQAYKELLRERSAFPSVDFGDGSFPSSSQQQQQLGFYPPQAQEQAAEEEHLRDFRLWGGV